MTLPTYRSEESGRPRLSGKRPAAKKSRWRRLFGRKALKRAAITLFILAALIGLFVGAKFLYNSYKLFGDRKSVV